MASQELRTFFPSPAHPALPIAAQLLSTLRNLTGPGKGVNLKPEERTALVGVAALLGCEKIQNKDLTESSAQKASHVAPSQFRSALTLSRRLLSFASSASAEALSSPRARSSPTKPTSTEANTAESSAEAAARAAALSPFSTPRKKFRPAASGVDLSGLNSRGAHSPAKGSPLKQSVTPSTTRAAHSQPGPSAEKADVTREDGEAGEEAETPSKRVKTTMASPRTSARKRRADESTSAFFAMRPGSMITPPDFSAVATNARNGRDRSASPTPRREAMGMLSAKRAARGERKRTRKMAKIDWTFREDVWAAQSVRQRNEAVIRKLLEDLPTFLSSQSLPSIESADSGSSIADILLQHARSSSNAMEVDA